MKSERFKDFQNTLKMLQFFNVRYTKVFHLKFCKDDLHTLEYTLLQLEKNVGKVTAAQITSTQTK